jgi:hypothetical protein
VNPPDYQRAVLDAWLALPITAARRPSRYDRDLALTLCLKQVPLHLVLAALKLAAQRIRLRPPDALPLPRVRSLAYFLPVIAELQRADPRYLDYLAAATSTGDCPNSIVSS